MVLVFNTKHAESPVFAMRLWFFGFGFFKCVLPLDHNPQPVGVFGKVDDLGTCGLTSAVPKAGQQRQRRVCRVEGHQRSGLPASKDGPKRLKSSSERPQTWFSPCPRVRHQSVWRPLPFSFRRRQASRYGGRVLPLVREVLFRVRASAFGLFHRACPFRRRFLA